MRFYWREQINVMGAQGRQRDLFETLACFIHGHIRKLYSAKRNLETRELLEKSVNTSLAVLGHSLTARVKFI